MASAAAVVERGDVTGHIMQPLHLQNINGHGESPTWTEVSSDGLPAPESMPRQEEDGDPTDPWCSLYWYRFSLPLYHLEATVKKMIPQ